MNKKTLALLPVMFAFFIMGFCDVVGISSNYIKADFNLDDTASNFIASMLFIWFFLLSVPVGIMMSKIGRKNTVLLSMIFTFVSLLVPFVSYTYATCLLAFALLGIGNTILQVALNPLVSNLVSGEKLTSSLTLGQFVKAISSFCGPIIAGWAAFSLGNWKLIFPIFAGISLISTIWLLLTPVEKEQSSGKPASFLEVFALLGDRTILLLFGGILFVVGVDVCTNMATPKILMERCGLGVEDASYGSSVYFAFRTLGAFLGAIILAKVSGAKFFRVCIIASVIAVVILLFTHNQWAIYACVAAIGLFCANIFSIIFSAALRHLPAKANEISGLMIMGVSGGAIFPLMMGYASVGMGSQAGSIIVIGLCMVYLTFASFAIKKA